MFEKDVNLMYVCENMIKLLSENMGIMECYQRGKYLGGVQGICVRQKPVFDAFEAFCEANPENVREGAKMAAEAFLRDAADFIEKRAQGKKSFAASMDMQTYRQILAAFVIPAMGSLNSENIQALIDAVRLGWNEAYPKYTFLQGDVETLNKGFELTRMGCYITTATCESLGKGDVCYELMAFRAFRDGYLREQPEGEALVARYYETAPAVVEAINQRPDATEIYQGIWEQYLSKCLKEIEDSSFEACQNRYQGMVETLQAQYC